MASQALAGRSHPQGVRSSPRSHPGARHGWRSGWGQDRRRVAGRRRGNAGAGRCLVRGGCTAAARDAWGL